MAIFLEPSSTRRTTSMRIASVLALTIASAIGCAGGQDVPDDTSGTGGDLGFGGYGGYGGSSTFGNGGSPNGGVSSTGGFSPSAGFTGSGGNTNGGAPSSGGALNGGGAGSGGASNGGSTSSGGASSGGDASTGGTGSGGNSSTGGTENGGATSTGGNVSTGGSGSGGAGAGGAGAGGTGSGGAGAGGAGAGGTGSGGAGAGGAGAGGAGAGGAGSGGTGSGGAGAGGAGSGGTGSGGAGAGGAGTGGTGSGGTGAGGAGTGGAGAGGADNDGGTTCPVETTAPGYVNLAPAMGQPLDNVGVTLNPPAPTGWTYYQPAGAVCRDGSPAGFFLHRGTADKLVWYLEGGGACISPSFCQTFNPANVNSALSGDGQTVLGSAFGVVAARQQPGVFEGGVVHGIFDLTNAANPFKDWNIIYTPYCTGDAWFGSQPNGSITGLAGTQQFVGHTNLQKFLSVVVPTFQGKLSRVVVTGASAGGFGAALNFSMFQDAFGCTKVDVLDDSGPPFTDKYMSVCMQNKWRTLWNFDASLPPDCTECRHTDGGGLLNLADFLMKKHPNATLGIVSSMNDEVIRLFYSPGLANCVNFDTANPVAITFLQGDPTVYMVAADYAAGLTELKSLYVGTGRLATYFLGGANITYHQHLWRPRFYDATAGTETIAQFTQNFLNGKMDQIGP